jgi:ribosomal protein S18 acetylase RimI-like enzyme
MNFKTHDLHLTHEKRIYRIVSAIDDAGEIVATCQIDPWDTDMPFLYGVHVREDRRRQGLGRALMNFVIISCTEADKHSLALYVHKNNEAAAALYRSLGFDRYIADGDNIFMARSLGGRAVSA